MIAFATIFLGLVLGVKDVELVVGDGVATVEVVLNGSSQGRVSEEPWRVECDFGDELVPLEMVAIARDAENREVGRARQWINLPQPPAQVTVAIEGAAGGKEAMARLSWESRAGARPQSFEISFDGTPLEVDDPEHFVLPPHDPRQLHFLRVELRFSDNVASVAEVTFGGTYADQVSTELTAVPVLGKKGKVKKLAAQGGLLTKDGEPLEVVAVEEGAGQVVVVPDSRVYTALDELSRYRFEGYHPLSERAAKLRGFARLGSKHFVKVMWPVVQHQPGMRQQFDLFPTSYAYGKDDGGLYFALFHAFQDPSVGVERLADAVAVAGLHAAELRQRRAVILLLGGPAPGEDPSQLSPGQSRRYLERLRIPFFVWSLAGEKDAGPWGEAVDVSELGHFEDAADGIKRHLDRQWLVWLDGVHLPQEISLAPGAEGVELVR